MSPHTKRQEISRRSQEVMATEQAEYHFDYCMRGYYVYKEVWQSNTDDILSCRREATNLHDPYAVCMMHRSGIVVGHVPRTISAVCSMFIRQGGSISCQVTGNRRYSAGLPQGGLELPCHLTFTGPSKVVGKLQKLLDKAPKLAQAMNPSGKEPLNKKAKLDETVAAHSDRTPLP